MSIYSLKGVILVVICNNLSQILSSQVVFEILHMKTQLELFRCLISIKSPQNPPFIGNNRVNRTRLLSGRFRIITVLKN